MWRAARSVVTPFYNTDPYLAECVESVLRQTHRNFEYILVDNQSSDRSGAIAEEYAKRDSRIRFIRSDQFRPQIPNYNYALQHISDDSRYVKIAQADDSLYPACLTELVAIAEANPNVAVASCHDLNSLKLYGSGLSPHQRVLTGQEAARLYLLKGFFFFGSPTSVLYRSDIVRERTPFFREQALHADTEVIFEILTNHDFAFVHQVLCFIRTQDDSLTARLNNMSDNTLDRLIIVKRFGKLYLSPTEYDDCLSGSLAWYYEELGRRWIAQHLGKPSDEFWEFQRKGLQTIGEKIRATPMIRAVGRMLLRTLLNPGKMAEKLRKVG